MVNGQKRLPRLGQAVRKRGDPTGGDTARRHCGSRWEGPDLGEGVRGSLGRRASAEAGLGA